jgi:hypothetical protein
LRLHKGYKRAQTPMLPVPALHASPSARSWSCPPERVLQDRVESEKRSDCTIEKHRSHPSNGGEPAGAQLRIWRRIANLHWEQKNEKRGDGGCLGKVPRAIRHPGNDLREVLVADAFGSPANRLASSQGSLPRRAMTDRAVNVIPLCSVPTSANRNVLRAECCNAKRSGLVISGSSMLY